MFYTRIFSKLYAKAGADASLFARAGLLVISRTSSLIYDNITLNYDVIITV
jgi:hypothetical protein